MLIRHAIYGGRGALWLLNTRVAKSTVLAGKGFLKTAMPKYLGIVV